MGAEKGKIAKNAMMLYLRMGIVLVVSLYTSRIILQQLGVSDYGTYNVVGGVITILSFLTGTISNGTQRFYNYYKGLDDYETLNKYFFSSFIIMIGIALFMVIFGETVGLWFLNSKMNIPTDRMYAANWVYQFSIISIVVTLATSPYNSLINAHEDFKIYAYTSILFVLLKLVIAYLVAVSPIDKLIFYAAAMCIVTILNSVINVVICKIRYRRVFFIKHRDKSIYKTFFTFSGWNMLGSSSYIAATTGMNIILNIFFGTIVNAARGIAVTISSQIDSLIQNIQAATNPQIVQLYARKEFESMRSLVDDNCKWNFAMYWLVALPVILQVNQILELWLGIVPDYAPIFTIIIVLRSLLKCFEGPVNMVNFAIGEVKWLNIVSSICTFGSIALACGLFYLGYAPYWGFIVDAIAIILVLTYNIYRAGLKDVYTLKHFAKTIVIPVILIMVVSFSLTFASIFMIEEGIMKLIVTFVISGSVSGLLIFYKLFTKNQRDRLLSIVKSKFARQ